MAVQLQGVPLCAIPEYPVVSELREDCVVFMGMPQWENPIGFCKQIMPLTELTYPVENSSLNIWAPTGEYCVCRRELSDHEDRQTWQ